MVLSDKQKDFFPWLLSQKERMVCLTGYAGTGKTTIMGYLKDFYPGNIQWLATTNYAKDVLYNKLNTASVITVHSALGMRKELVKGEWRFLPTGKNKINPFGLVVIDEASMLNSECLDLLNKSCAKHILFVGDDFQIPPVYERQSPVYQLNIPAYTLTEVFRHSAGVISNLATDVRMNGLDYAWERTDVYGIDKIDMSELSTFYSKYPDGVVLCATHKVKDYCNSVARKLFNNGKEDLFKDEILVLEDSLPGEDAPRRGDRIKITCRPVLTVFRGFVVWQVVLDEKYDVYIPVNYTERRAVQNRRHDIKKEYDNAKTHEDRGRLTAEQIVISEKIVFATTGYAQTIHSAQGNEYDDVMLSIQDLHRCFGDSEIRTRMIYTAITRAKKTLTIGI